MKPKKCSECKKPAVIFRKYEGRALCKQHFKRSLESKVKLTIRKNKMLDSKDRICVALSGGLNSGVAAHVLNKITEPRPDVKLFALHVDEGVKGFSNPSRKAAEKLSEKLGINLAIFSFKEEFGKTMDQKVREKLEMEPNTYAAVGRRWILNKYAREMGATKIATGHNLDAEVEAILLNYIRGDLSRAARSGAVTDWSTKKPGGKKFVPRIKPLRKIPEEETKLYAKINGIKMHDRDASYYEGMREEVGKFLKELEDRYTGTEFSIISTFDKIRPELKKKAKGGEGRILLCKRCGEPGSAPVCETCKLWR